MDAPKIKVSEEGKKRSYYKYYLKDIAEIPASKQEILKNPKGDPADALRNFIPNSLSWIPGLLTGSY